MRRNKTRIINLRTIMELDIAEKGEASPYLHGCLLYTSDAADERSSVDLGGRRIIKKKKMIANDWEGM